MKMSKEELIAIINDSEISDEMKVSLMEDITDSFEEVPEVDLSGYVEKAKYDELLEKYKARFLSGEEKEDDKKEDDKKEDEETEELKEEEVIDVKEI